MWNMILGDDTPLHVHITRKTKKRNDGLVVSEPEKKEYKFVFKKGRLMDHFEYFSYDYN